MSAYESLPPHGPNGSIEVIAGPMFSGKTEELLRRVRRAVIAKQSVQVFKPERDDRYAKLEVVSHDDTRMQAVPVVDSAALEASVTNEDVIGIDEVQFFDAGIIDVCNRLADRGIRVVAAGLDLDYRGRPFGPMPLLMAHAEYVSKLHAVCCETGGRAHFSFRTSEGNGTIQLGGTDEYKALCRDVYNKVYVREHTRRENAD
jgi:thymidine kinase